MCMCRRIIGKIALCRLGRTWSPHTEVIGRVSETVSRTVEGLDDELEGSAVLCVDTSLVNTETETETETETLEVLRDERWYSEENDLDVIRGMVLTDGEEEGDELAPAVPEAVPPKLKY